MKAPTAIFLSSVNFAHQHTLTFHKLSVSLRCLIVPSPASVKSHCCYHCDQAGHKCLLQKWRRDHPERFRQEAFVILVIQHPHCNFCFLEQFSYPPLACQDHHIMTLEQNNNYIKESDPPKCATDSICLSHGRYGLPHVARRQLLQVANWPQHCWFQRLAWTTSQRMN